MPNQQPIKPPSKAQLIKELLLTRPYPTTVQEILLLLQLPDSDAKFVSSILSSQIAKMIVKVPGVICTRTNKIVTGYMLDPTVYGIGNMKTANPTPRPAQPTQKPPKPRKQRQQKPDPLVAAQQARAEAKRRAAEKTRQARETYHKAEKEKDQIKRAYLIFQKVTGCSQRNFDEMNAAFRKVAFGLHPDRGGNSEKFAMLSEAWGLIKGEFKKAVNT